ncbi:MAG TPA: S8 family serine peptidase [Gemmatimonadales bacterium]|nr:S8 family serine peptidase [Gemmatimonadales bacterium]
MTRNCLLALGLALFVAACGENAGPTDTNPSPDFASANATQQVNVLLKARATAANRAELSRYGNITDEIASLNALSMKAKADKIPAIRALAFVKSVSLDQPRSTPPVEVAEALDIAAGANVWNLDAINVTDKLTGGRKVDFDGTGVYVAQLDTGLLPFWPFYFAGKNIDTEHAVAFGGLGLGNNPTIPHKWENDVDAHGTHVASIILGFQFASASTGGVFQINGVAPAATLIPVKVLHQTGSGTSFTVAKGITYVADLFNPDGGELAGKRVVVNMSLGGAALDPVEKEAFDLAISRNVVLVAAASNEGPDGPMAYPGGYPPVISVASAGWIGEWGGNNPACTALPNGVDEVNPARWWRQCDVPDPYDQANFYINDFSSEPDPTPTGFTEPQDLDVAAPGSWVVGPYQLNQGNPAYFFVGGTSQATAHVTGIVALILQKNPSLSPAAVEDILEDAAQQHALNDVGQQVAPDVGLPLEGVPSWATDGRAGNGFITADAALAETP